MLGAGVGWLVSVAGWGALALSLSFCDFFRDSKTQKHRVVARVKREKSKEGT